jgi:hypothetical protein
MGKEARFMFDLEWSPAEKFPETFAKYGDAWTDALSYTSKVCATRDEAVSEAKRISEGALHGHFVVHEIADEPDEWGNPIFLGREVLEVDRGEVIYSYKEREVDA